MYSPQLRLIETLLKLCAVVVEIDPKLTQEAGSLALRACGSRDKALADRAAKFAYPEIRWSGERASCH